MDSGRHKIVRTFPGRRDTLGRSWFPLSVSSPLARGLLPGDLDLPESVATSGAAWGYGCAVERADREVIQAGMVQRKQFLESLSDDVPWWALGLLDIPGEAAKDAISFMEAGKPERVASKDRRLEAWLNVRAAAQDFAKENPLEVVRAEAEGKTLNILRTTALRSERAFVQICNITHQGKVWDLADFHVHTIRAMRQQDPVAIFLPWQHGKTALSSRLVPLMDWAEWPDATECRVFWNQSNAKKAIQTLKNDVQFNSALHKVFPWIRKPNPEDPAQNWNESGFSIGGRSDAINSFEVLTARGESVGNRYSRTGCDDWANSGNGSSLSIQNRLMNYLLSGPMTFREYTDLPSPYGTKWGTMFYDGTFYDLRDVGYRFYQWCKEHEHTAIRFDVYPLGAEHPTQVLWQKGRPPEYIEDMKKQLLNMFNKRARNIVMAEDEVVFSDKDVDAACEASRKTGGLCAYGKLPAGARAIIGLDPGSGSTSRHAADPAIALYAEVPSRDRDGNETGEFDMHFVKWSRLHGFDFVRQCAVAVAWAREFRVPIVIEKNATQGSYKSHIRSNAPDILVYDHQTGSSKWNNEDGVSLFGPSFKTGHAIIHADGAPEDELQALVEEFKDWPQPRHQDIIMAFWFAKSGLPKNSVGTGSLPTRLQLPSYVQRFASSFNLR